MHQLFLTNYHYKLKRVTDWVLQLHEGNNWLTSLQNFVQMLCILNLLWSGGLQSCSNPQTASMWRVPCAALMSKHRWNLMYHSQDSQTLHALQAYILLLYFMPGPCLSDKDKHRNPHVTCEQPKGCIFILSPNILMTNKGDVGSEPWW
jgi:hypothetical protein